jgi:type IV pilus assembly protein PilY1
MITWRLGDIINSKPVIVGPPSYNYDILFHDATYAAFKTQYGSRRQVAYFGSNDGMLHAVNLGSYGSLSSGTVGYTPGTGHELGSEIWAYIPQSLLPHLKWQAVPGYTHSYYVDLVPSVFDVMDNGEWKTILLAGLRLGGRPIQNPNKEETDEPIYFSEIFAFDITDPESEPKFLWSYSTENLGLSVASPTVVKTDGKWYAVLASGPKTDTVRSNWISYGENSPYDGYSNQNASLTILHAYSGDPVVESLTVPDNDSFFSDPFVPIGLKDRTTGDWNNHVIYYGLTVSRNPGTCVDGGAVYRVKMTGDEGQSLNPLDWTLERMVDVGRPVTGSVNSTYDIDGNLWVTFATGRLWGLVDLMPCSSSTNKTLCETNHENYLYGIKESLDANGRLTYADLTDKMGSLYDVSNIVSYSNGTVGNVPLPDGTFTNLYYTAFQKSIRNNNSVLGYKRKLNMGSILRTDASGGKRYEVNFTQPKITGLGRGESLISFTTFEPNATASYCGGLGHSYMYLLDTFTGVPQASQYMYSAFANEVDRDTLTPEDARTITGGIYTGTEKDSESNFYKAEGRILVRSSSGDNTVWDIELKSSDSFGSYAISWREALNSGFELSPDTMIQDLSN